MDDTNLEDGYYEESDECDNEIYSRLLFVKRRGFPMWSPRLDNNLPQEYLDTGIRIGDVGIITADGFLPLELPNTNRSFTRIRLDDPGSVIASGITFFYREPQSPDHLSQSDPRRCYSLKATRDEGALLILPEGSLREDLKTRALFRKYACDHGESWYNHWS
ncbi:hypothetical protein BDQ17DRAFT_1548519 [Cyathus striatus]|nr:hypothetical protein BDQ17DRAFT_1548519 [Cyathus striatus]